AKMFIPMSEIVDVEKERARLEKEKETALSEIERVTKKLNNPSFTEKAPKTVVDEERAKLEKYTAMLKSVEEMLENL
ncbi:MAG: hypothetical protein IKX77_02155, partial [Clostridia bacterium]|nr:hypothetical protein [Clostridia bacterium]